jgi:amino acid transporter
VRRAFGPFWAFQAGWWSWLNSFVDVAVYPALFADYLKFWWPGMSSLGRWVVVLAFVWALTALNLLGVRITGWTAVALAGISFLPMLVFTAVAAARAAHVPWQPLAAPGQGIASGLGLGLAVMMWNYSGWDTPTTCLGETRSPKTAFRRAQFVALPLITLGYVLPVGAGLAASRDWAKWDTGYWPVVAAAVGGPRVSALVALGALVATAGLFVSLLLTNSRLPFVLATAGQMPAALGRVHPRFGTPWAAVILSSACYSVCAFWSFKDLIVLNVWLYSIALILEMLAFVALRLREPDMPRPWRVGGGRAGMWATAALPVALSLLAMATAGWTNTLVGTLAALTGPAAYLLWRGAGSRVAIKT